MRLFRDLIWSAIHTALNEGRITNRQAALAAAQLWVTFGPVVVLDDDLEDHMRIIINDYDETFKELANS